MRRLLALIAGLAVIASACTGSSETPDTTAGTTNRTTGSGTVNAVAERFNPQDVQFVAALQRFDECAGFLDWIKAEALAQVGPYGLEGRGFSGGFEGDDGGVEEMAAASTVAAAADAAVAERSFVEGVDFSGTNVQVAGVDEPDIVKTDGTRVLAVVGNTLYHIDVTGEPRVADRVKLGDGWNHRIFMQGDRALAFANVSFHAIPVERLAASSISITEVGSLTEIYDIDLSDPEDIEITRTMLVEGNLVSARAVGETVRVVVSSYPDQLPFVFPSGPASEERAAEVNRQVIEDSVVEDWLPGYVVFEGDDEVDSGLVGDCDNIHAPDEFAGFEALSVLTIDFGEPLARQAAATLLARGETVYASQESLYVATNVWVPPAAFERDDLRSLAERYETAIHKFDITGSDPAEYVASGSVEGHLLNQFSLNEHEGRLQVATTSGAPWGFQDQSESFVSVFNQDGDRLAQIGQVGELGRGERIFSARFIGDTAYVVTFREVDPLYVVDLSDPTNPTVRGELKIPGFSSYLHPIGDDRLIGVGSEATETGRITGAKVSLFDVSDPADPREVDTWTLPNASTDVQWDHHAFLYWPPEQKAVLPLQAWAEGFFGAVVLDTADGLAEEGRISHDRLKGEPGATDCDVITPADLGVDRFPIEPGLQLQVCGAEDDGGAFGYWCEDYSPDDSPFVIRDVTGVDPPAGLVGVGDMIQLCWPNFEGNPILRSLVIDGDLWTLTRLGLQANSLADLSLQHSVTLN